ncbi:MAG: ABC transporter ATP-binding protein [Spirochaetes bacterium]|nr:MAG: ABC transporter ATP-binding protein [Spirochaetota bacterium]
MLELKNIFYSVDNKDILEGLNLTVPDGEIYSIIGVNGTGKTTLAGIIMGLEGYKPDKGSIIFNGSDITDYSVTERAKLGITLAWQIPAFFEGVTVYEYLSLKDGNGKPEDYLDFVGLNPDKYLGRIIDESLSGGERKRIELASVLSVNPKLVILDEPDSGIDMASIDAIRNVIFSFKKAGASILLITHNEVMASMGDVVSLLCEGIIIKQGNPYEVSNYFKTYCYDCTSMDDPKCEDNEEAMIASVDNLSGKTTRK